MADVIASNDFDTPVQGDITAAHHFVIIEDETTAGLQVKLEAAVATVSGLPNNAITILDMNYVAAQLANNQISYSVLLHYVLYG